MTRIDASQLGEAIREDLGGFQHGAVEFVASRALEALVRPVGAAPGIPVATGFHRSGFRVGVPTAATDALPPGLGSYPISGDPEVDAALASWEPGDTIQIASHTGVPAILDRGRKTGDDGVMRGSEQAPEGYAQQGLDQVAEDLETWSYQP